MRRGWLGVVGSAATVMLWQALSVWPWQLSGLPSPISVAEGLVASMLDMALWRATAETLTTVAIATAVATLIGLLAGTAIGMSARVDRFTSSTVNSLRFVPPVALIPVVLLLFGFGTTSAVVLGVSAALWPVLINVAAAVRELDLRYADLARAQRLGTLGRMRKIFIPGALTATLVGVRISVALALIVVVAAEMLAVPIGLGQQIRFLGDALRLPEMYGYILWTGVVGYVLNGALEQGRRVLAPWARAVRG